MQKLLFLLLLSACNLFSVNLSAQPDETQPGAWYMYFWSANIQSGPWGFQGDVQYRNWNIAGDLEQLLLRGGATYQPRNTPVKFTLGYAYVATGAFGPEKTTFPESRTYLEALLPQKIGARFYLTHRFRYEQRWVENQDFRTRFRYNLFLNIPLNKKDFQPGAVYLALYNELFINGQRNIGEGQVVELFDRNRAYAALGYSLSQGLRAQLGFMVQTTDAWEKRQLQLSLHHNF